MNASSENALSVLRKHGKSFRFAGMFLSGKQLEQAACLYQFCRWIDDIADETADKQNALLQLQSIQNSIRKDSSDEPILNEFLILSRSLNIPSILPLSLIDGVLSDLDTVQILDAAALIRYAYRVAGTVGLMMCPILNADSRGYAHAVDLGIGMQLSNIARDVWEDAQLGRRYLPYTWCPFTPHQILDNAGSTQDKVKSALTQLLALADSYYASGAAGYPYLPLKSRRAISIAATIYREIGVKLNRNKLNYWQGRTVVSLPQKVQLATKTIFINTVGHKPIDTNIHSAKLHDDLRDLLPDWKQT